LRGLRESVIPIEHERKAALAGSSARRTQANKLLTARSGCARLAALEKQKRPEPHQRHFNQSDSASLRLLIHSETANFKRKAALEARPTWGVPKAFFLGRLAVPAVGRV
jgi:hypothetical protein